MKTSAVLQSSQERKGIEWSLSPILTFSKICGIPAIIHEPKGSVLHRVMGVMWMLLSLVCLSLNSFFQIFNCFTASMFCSLDDRLIKDGKGFPYQWHYLLKYIVEQTFKFGVPLCFAFQFYFTGKFQQIINTIRKFDEEIVFRSGFYRKCRKRCIFLIAISCMEFVLYLTERILYSSTKDPFKLIIAEFNFGKIVYFLEAGLPDKCVINRIRYSKEFLAKGTAPVYKELSLAAAFWVQLSIIATLNIFCALVAIASLLAEELDRRTKKKAFPIEKKALELTLQKWLIEFDRFIVLVERIKSCFGPILVLAVAYYFVMFPMMVQHFLMYGFFSHFPSYVYKTLIFIRLGTIVAVCNQLETKAKGYQNSLHRLPNSTFAKLHHQRETVGLQVSSQPDLKIIALDIYEINAPMIVTLLGVSLPYAYILFESHNEIFGKSGRKATPFG